MSITELAIHNVLRTYSRQDRLGRLQKATLTAPAIGGDKLDLSSKAQKMALIGKTAEDIVTERFPGLADDQKQEMVRTATGELLASHQTAVEDKSVTPDSFEEQLRSIYLPK